MKKLSLTRAPVVALTAEQEAIKRLYLPRAPEHLSKTARLLFDAAANKIKFTPTENGGLVIDDSPLSPEERFAIGRGIFDPSSVTRDLRNVVWRPGQLSHPDSEGRYNVVMQPSAERHPDLVAAESRLREKMRMEILVNAHGEQFPVGRRKGAFAPIHLYLQNLYQRICPQAFEDFWEAIRAEAENHAADGLITLHEVEGTTLRYNDRGKDKVIEKNTIRNKFKSYKKI